MTENKDDFYRRYKDAIVAVQSIILAPIDNSNIRLRTSGTGFFIRKHSSYYIVTCAHLVFYQSFGVTTPATAIYVTVTNVNNKECKNLNYQASIMGVDFVSDIAVLKISHELEWNKKLPPIKGQKYLKFGHSRQCSPGKEVYIFGNTITDFQALFTTNIQDNRYFDTQNIFGDNIMIENVIVNYPGLSGQSGGPILTCDGLVIGVMSFWLPDSSVHSMAGGPSQHFIYPVIKALTRADNCDCKACNKHVKLVNNYFIYVKAYLGISWRDYNANDWFDHPSTDKSMGGIIIEPNSDSPLIPILSSYQGPILLTHIDKYEIGPLDNQITPGLVLWRLVGGDNVNITYRVADDNFNKAYNAKVTLTDYPTSQDIIQPNSSLLLNGNKKKQSKVKEAK